MLNLSPKTAIYLRRAAMRLVAAIPICIAVVGTVIGLQVLSLTPVRREKTRETNPPLF